MQNIDFYYQFITTELTSDNLLTINEIVFLAVDIFCNLYKEQRGIE